MAETPPPRLTVLAARDADVAVVVRRGPSDWARLSRWDTAHDTVEHGGWVRARVDGRRCDLSPDGRLFVAFLAAHGRPGTAPPGDGSDWRRSTWVAISRPPWWQALALWFDGTTWAWGGFFPDSSSCVIGPQEPDRGEVPPWFDSDARLPHPHPHEWTTRTAPHNRRHRDGWSATADGRWERPLASGGAALTSDVPHGTNHTGARAALRFGDDLVPLGEDASLDVDRRGRALVARAGRLEVHTGPSRIAVVDDLRDHSPEPRPAPAWAGSWPGPANS